MNFPADNSTQTNTALATTGTSATYADSNVHQLFLIDIKK